MNGRASSRPPRQGDGPTRGYNPRVPMTWIDVTIWMVAAACMTLAAMHLRIWISDRRDRANASFALVAIGVAWFGLCELALVRADSTARYADTLQWTHVPIFMMVAGIASFVAVRMPGGRTWLAYAACAGNLLTLAVSLAWPPYADFVTLTGLRRVEYLGVTVAVPEGQTSAWHWVGQLSYLFLVLFVADASAALWRTGSPSARRRALALGGSIVLFVVLSAGQAALLYAGLIHVPHLGAPTFFPVLLVMGYELSGEVLAAARLARQLQESESSLRESEGRMRVAADEAQQISGRLIAAQEDERRRIARELHDDLSQRLGVMSVHLDLLRRARGAESHEGLVERVAGEIRSLSAEIHALSYTLHPAKLDQLGLVAAARAWCRDLSLQSGVEFAFSCDAVPDEIPPDAALCLYRILQEGTRNVVRHSGAAMARVHLVDDAGEVRLVIEDDGVGFDGGGAGAAGGLGLVSMRERTRLLGGRLAVESSRGSGTRISVSVPVPGGEARETVGAIPVRGGLHDDA